MKSKEKIRGGSIIAKPYQILAEAVETGVNWGWARAHKHTDKPDEEHIKTQIVEHVMCEVAERFEFKP